MKTAFAAASFRATAVLALLGALSPWALAAEGEQWEYTMTLVMAGRDMPMAPVTMCTRPQNVMAPGSSPDCKVSNLKVAGNKASFHVSCTGANAMEGDGEGTRTGDKVSGSMHMKGAQGEMVMKHSGRKLGSCANPIN